MIFEYRWHFPAELPCLVGRAGPVLGWKDDDDAEAKGKLEINRTRRVDEYRAGLAADKIRNSSAGEQGSRAPLKSCSKF